MKSLRASLAALVVVTALVFSVGAEQAAAQRNGRGHFVFGLIGDTPYTLQKEVEFVSLIERMNHFQQLSFVVHVGDIKAGGGGCPDQIYFDRRDLFNLSRAPFIYTPGDNEWTDCTPQDPLNRLNFLRGVFFPDNRSLGQRTLELTRQSDADPAFPEFVENARWVVHNVLFMTAHVVGSNNNCCGSEFQRRETANLAWLDDSFDLAEARGYRAVMILMQASPTDWLGGTVAFGAFITRLRERVLGFSNPVVLVHGDSHYFRIDKPLRSGNLRIERFTRVEVFGSPYTHWILASVDPNNPNVFSFDPMLVKENLLVAP